MQDAALLMVGAVVVVAATTLRAPAPARRRSWALAFWLVPAMLVAALAIAAAINF